MRLNFRAAARALLGRTYYEARIRTSGLPRSKGYTANTVVTEWLTLNCAGDWASTSLSGRAIVVRFFEAADFERARARFAPNTAWRPAGSKAEAGFEHPG